MSKTKTYTNVLPLETISLKLGNHLQQQKCEVSYCGDEENKTWCFIQTRKNKHIKSIDEKCIDISIQGTQDECKITIGSGKWGENTIDSSNPPTMIPYDGIFATDKKSMIQLITERDIWKFLEKNI